MEIYKKLTPVGSKTSVALGYFDGIHRGHSEIIRQTVDYARTMHLRATVFTFDFTELRPGEKGNNDLFDREFVYEKMENLGIDAVVEVPFEEIRNMSGRGFIANVLGHKCLNAAIISCGEDFRFGKGRDSDVAVMKLLTRPHGIQVNIVSFVMDDGIISTTRLKRLVEMGEIATVNQLLGFNYLFEAKTIKKDPGVGINYSTFSQKPNRKLLLPKYGVYLSRCLVNDEYHFSVTYIGTRPTKHKGFEVYADTNILDFAGEIAIGETMRVELLRVIRAEERFIDLGYLKDAILQDIERAKMLLL